MSQNFRDSVTKEQSLLSLVDSFCASLLRKAVASGAIPPVVDTTKGKKFAFIKIKYN